MDEDESPTDDRQRRTRPAPLSDGILDRVRWISKRVLVRTAIGISLLVVLGWIAASMGAGLRFAVPFALHRAIPQGWTADVATVRGSWLGHLELSGLTFQGPNFTLATERLSVRYRLGPLFARTVDIRELRVERPTIRVTTSESAAGQGDDAVAERPSMVASMLAGRPVGSWAVRVGSAEIVDGHVELQSTDPSRYTLAGVRLAARGSLSDQGLTMAVDTLRADFVSVLETSADSLFRSTGRMSMAGELKNGRLRLDTLQLTSDRSRVAGGGQVAFGIRPDLWDGVDLELDATPLDLRDLPLNLPAVLREHPDMTLSLTARGSPDSLRFAVDAGGFGGETTAEARGVLRPDLTDVDRTETASPALEGSLRFEGLGLSGWSAAPFDGTASGSVTLKVQRLGAASPFSGEGVVEHRPRSIDTGRLVSRPLRGRFEVSGRLPEVGSGMSGDTMSADEEPGLSGSGPLHADAKVTLGVGPSWRSLGSVSARIDGSRAEWRVDLALDSARVRGSGDASWLRSNSGSIDRLDIASLDLRAIDTVYPSTDISGELTGRVEGSSPEDLRGRIEIALGPSSVTDISVDTLELDSDIRGRRLEGGLHGRGSIGEVETRYTVALSDSLVRFETAELEYVRRDSTEEAVPAIEVYGRTSGSWLLSDTRTGMLHAVLDSARWRGRTATDVDVTARLDGERAVADVELDAEGVGPTPVTLRGHVDATGTKLRDMRGSARLAASRSHAADPGMIDSLQARIGATEGGHFEVDGLVTAAEGGGLTFGGTADASQTGLGFELTAEGSFAQPLALLRGASIDSIFLEASGSRDSLEWRGVSADLTVVEARRGGLVASRAFTSLAYDSAGLRLDTLELGSNVFQARGSGVIPVGGRSGRIQITAELLDLDPVREMTGRDVLGADGGDFDLTVTGSLDSLAWTSSIDAQAIVLDRIRMNGMRLTGKGAFTAPHDAFYGISSTELDLTLDRIILPHAEVRSVEVNATGGPDSIRVRADALVDDRRRGSALIQIDPRLDRKTARIEDLDFQIDDDRWLLVDEALVRYGEGVSVEPVLLRAGEQELRLEGGVSEDGGLDLNARVDSMDVTTVADLVGFPRLRGWVTGRVRVQGTTSAPEAWVDANGAFHRANRPPGPVDIRIRSNGRSVRGDLRLQDSGTGSLRLSGGALLDGPGTTSVGATPSVPSRTDESVPSDTTTILGFASDSIDVTMAADSFNLRWLEAFVTADALESIGGHLNGSLELSGSSSAPTLEGGLALRDGTARPTALGVDWETLSMTIRGRGADLVIDSTRISGTSGELTADGTIGIAGSMPLDLQVLMDEFQAIHSDAYWAVVSGTVDVSGAATSPALEGQIRVEALDVFLDERVRSEGLETVELTDRDLQMLRERFGIVPDAGASGRPLSERITADLTVELGRDSWLRKRTSPEMAVPFSGTIDVTMRPGQEPSLQGSVEVIPGRGFVEQFGRRFDLSEGTVTFSGPPSATRVDLEATYAIPSHDNPDDAEVTIILDVTGTQDDLGLTLSSDPQMENADIVSYVATGRPAAGSLSFGSGGQSEGGLVAAGADFALGQMTSLIESAAARSVGLDVIEIRREGLRQATLVAGKYVSPRLYVGFAQPVSLQEGDNLSFGNEGRSKLEIEYEALRWLLINIEGSGSSLRLFLRGRHAY